MTRIGIETRLVWIGDFVGGLFGDVLWACRFSGAMVFPFSFFFLFYFLLLGAQGF